MPEMTHADIAALHEKIGKVLANQETAGREIAELKQDFAHSNEQSSEYRKDIREAVTDLGERTSELEMRMDQFGKDLEKDVLTPMRDEVMPTVVKVRDWEKVGIGAIAATGMVASGISAGLMWVVLRWNDVVQFFKNL